MNQRDEQWGQEDDPIVERLREEKPRASGFELDRMKLAVMAKVKPSRSLGSRPRSRIAAALLTVGLMAGGTAGTVAATSGSTAGVGAATAEYHKCDHGGPKDRAKCRKKHCDHGGPRDRARCRHERGDGGGGGDKQVVVKNVRHLHRA